LDQLEKSFQSRGIRIQRHRSKVQLTTSPDVSDDVERFLQLESSQKLTRASLEALSIIAYQQPVTRPEIDAIRGVNSDSVLKTLLRLGLIEETGRSDSPGRPILYASTSEFLQHFGLSSLRDLPPLNLPFQSEDEAESEDEETAQ
jgi:segregation and condensation protein B